MSLSQGGGCLPCPGAVEVGDLLPHLAGLVVDEVLAGSGGLCIRGRVRAREASCPACGMASGRVHSRYERRLADAPVGGRRVVILLAVRRFFCGAPGCERRTFAEQVKGLTVRHGRQTVPLAAALGRIAAALAGRAGARLAGALGMTAGRDCLLRLLMAVPVPEPGTVRVLGVDDFAFRKGRDYGTILIDMESGRPVDLLPDREAGTLAGWLRARPGTEVICRDRAGAYAQGARDGAPAAVQVADRWHLWHNLAGHAEKAAARNCGCPRDAGPGDGTAAAALATRAAQRWELVQSLRARGKGIREVMQESGLSQATVRRYCRAATPGELAATAGRRSLLDPHKPYLHQRWLQGETRARQLHEEIRARGYGGSFWTLRDYLRPHRQAGTVPPATAGPGRPAALSALLLSDPGSLDEDQAATLARARERCPHLDALARHVASFAEILAGRHGSRLDDWLTAVEASDQPDLHSFARGIRQDHDAVRNGLTLPWNSGPVEGNVNRLKTLKRQAYGRAGFQLLRQRVLLPS